MRGKYSEQQKIATDKFLKKNYESITFRVHKGKRVKIQEMAENMGYSVNALLEYLIDREAERQGIDLSVPPTPSQQKKSEE